MFMMRNLLKNDEFQLDEIIFAGRNKAYGAYALRHEADRVLTKAMFIGIAFAAVASITPMVINAFSNSTTVIEHPPLPDGVLIDVTEPVYTPPPATVVPPKVQDVATVNTIVPTPTVNPVKQDPPATISDRDNALSGFENKKGVPPTTSVTPPVNVPAVTGPVNTAPPVVVDNSPATVVDVEASFNGGINSFRNKVASNFDTGSFDGSGEKLSAVITFIVEKDGSISQVKASGKDATFNKEAERAIKGIKGKWTPAKVGDQYVRSYFKFPISMAFE